MYGLGRALFFSTNTIEKKSRRPGSKGMRRGENAGWVFLLVRGPDACRGGNQTADRAFLVNSETSMGIDAEFAPSHGSRHGGEHLTELTLDAVD